MRSRVPVKLIVSAVAVVASYLAGYLPERGRRVEAETRATQLESRLTASDGKLRVGELLGQVLAAKDAAARNDYGRGADLASPLFDAVRTETSASLDERVRAGLGEVLARRDAVTAALARADPGSVAMMQEIELRLREALGYPTPAAASVR